MNRDGWGRVITAFAIGAGVGAAAGIFFAPAEGAKTRARVGAAARNGFEHATEKGRELKNRASDAVDDAAEELGHAVDAGTKAYRRAKSA